MGDHAFSSTPDHMAAIPERHAVVATAAAGASAGWNLPVALWHAPHGFDATAKPDEYKHHTLTIQLTPGMCHRVRANGEIVEGNPQSHDSFCLQPAKQDNRFVCADEIRFAHLYFTAEFSREVAVELFGERGDSADQFRTERMFTRDRGLRHSSETYLRRALDTVDPPTPLEMDARATLLGLQLVKRLSVLGATAARPSPRNGLTRWQLRRVTERLEADLANNVPLTALAQLLDLSPNHFCTAFRISLGEPPHRYLVRRRIERARELLADPRLSITEVALAVGFGSSAHFATAFRKIVGLTPSAYRRERSL